MATSVKINATEIGKAFGHVGSNEQSEILNAFGSELFIACRGDNGTFEKQCCWISDSLDNNGKRLITELAEFIKLREKTFMEKS